MAMRGSTGRKTYVVFVGRRPGSGLGENTSLATPNYEDNASHEENRNHGSMFLVNVMMALALLASLFVVIYVFSDH
ncbi:hypothetical protein SESBI_34273 [Sesbania bispinosa]|nr:hypothetical protein SESBI_34273 [Sesbania bispinosa]